MHILVFIRPFYNPPVQSYKIANYRLNYPNYLNYLKNWKSKLKMEVGNRFSDLENHIIDILHAHTVQNNAKIIFPTVARPKKGRGRPRPN